MTVYFDPWPSSLALKTVYYHPVPSTLAQMTVQFGSRPYSFGQTGHFKHRPLLPFWTRLSCIWAKNIEKWILKIQPDILQWPMHSYWKRSCVQDSSSCHSNKSSKFSNRRLDRHLVASFKLLYLDVYYSGILRKKAGIPLDDEDRLSEMHCTYLDEELYRWKYKNLMKTKNLTLLYHESTYW